MYRINAESIELDLHVVSGSSMTSIVGQHDSRLKVKIAELAVNGKANEVIRELIAEVFGIRKFKVRIVRGALASRKTILVESPTPIEIQSFLKKIAEFSD